MTLQRQTYSQHDRALVTTEYHSETHLEEFVKVVDSLGRIWDALKHPRDHLGRFIRTFSNIKFNMPGEHGEGSGYSGTVLGVDQDGTLHSQVTGVPEGAAPGGPAVGDVIRLNNDDVEVQTIKAKLFGRGAAGKLNQSNDLPPVNNAIDTLNRLGLDAEATELSEIRDIAMEDFNPRDPNAQARKDSAIDRFRKLAEHLDEIRGEGFADGTSLDDVKDQLTSEEKDKVKSLGTVIDVTFRARHALGDKTIDAASSEGAVKAKMSEVRLNLGRSKLQENYATGKQLWDATGATLTKGKLEQPAATPIIDTARPDAAPNPNIISSLIRSSYAKYRSGLNRTAGYKQAQRVAPGARTHVDKNDDEIIVGSTVMLDANPDKGRPEATMGQVMHIAYDKQSGKTVMKVREFDPEFAYNNTTAQGKVLPYIDRRGIPSKSIELADDEHQNTMFTNLALQGKTAVIEQMKDALAEDTIAKLQQAAGRRFAEAGAKRTSPTGAVDAIPIHERVKKDMHGESLHIGDHVMDPNGGIGIVIYAEPKLTSNTVKVMYPNGQVSERLTSKTFQRMHGPSSEVAPGSTGYGDSNYVPTREEAASQADEIGATSVAEAIRSGADASAIQTAMGSDQAFQDNVAAKADALFDRRDQALSTGGEPTEEEKAQLSQFDVFAAASAGQFREPNDPPAPTEPMRPPEPEAEGERPENPANPEQKVTEGGATVREEGDETIVDENVEDPIPTSDTQGVEDAINQAEGEKQGAPETPPEEPPAGPPALADKVLSDIGKLVEEAKTAPNVDSHQRAQLDQLMGRLTDAHARKDGPGMVRALESLTGMVNRQVNGNLHQTRLRQVLNRATVADGKPVALHNLVQQRLDAGDDIFSGAPMQRAERAPEPPTEVPEGVNPEVDALDNVVSDALLADDQTSKVTRDGQEVTEGFYVVDPDATAEFDTAPTEQDLADFITQTQASGLPDISVWFNESDGTWRMARVGVFDTEEEAAGAAETNGSNQYVNIADGSVMNLALTGDPNQPPEAIEDPRSEERHVRTAGTGTASAPTTAKQKVLLDQVGENSGDEEIARISAAIKNGEEVSGADASRLADAIDAMDAGQFDKPSDKGLASQLAHKLARATGEEGVRGYSSQATALSRNSSVGIGLTAQSQNDEVRRLVTAATDALKAGDNATAADDIRQAADAWEAAGLPADATAVRRAREHADRLDAMGGTTAPAPEGPSETPVTPPEPGQGDVVDTATSALADAGVPEVTPITQSMLSDTETDRSRPVSAQEFAALAVQGKTALEPHWDNASEPSITSGEVLSVLKGTAWDAVQEEWGGLTVDAHNAQAIDPDTGFAVTVKHPGMETVTVPLTASQDEFNTALETAMQRFGGDENSPLWMDGAHLGVFRNEDTGTFDMDPVLVLDSLEDVEAIGAYTSNLGGAYSFADGLGYWPPHIAEGADSGEGQAVPGEVARPGGQGGEAQPGVGPPGEAGPEGPAGGGPEAPNLGGSGVPGEDEINQILGNADAALESERQAEDENGPQGWTSDMEELNNQLLDLMAKVKANPNDTSLATDLRALASEMGGKFHLTDAQPFVDELNDLADRIDAGGQGASPPTPPDAGGDRPFVSMTQTASGTLYWTTNGENSSSGTRTTTSPSS